MDGIRAIAILLVMASHAHPTALKGGELGVDVFFALSGFLITTLILEETQRGEGAYGFARFYARRALRLFPALYAVVLASGLYLWLRWDHLPEFLLGVGVTDPDHRNLYPVFLLGAATYTTNLIGVLATPGNFLGHTWSLALEEQFYLIWPVVLVTFWRRTGLHLLTLLLVAFIGACLTCRLAGVPVDRGFLWMRPEAIAAGALVAILRWRGDRMAARLRTWSPFLVYAGLLIIILAPIARGRLIPLAYFDKGLVTMFGLSAAVLIWALVELSRPMMPTAMLTSRPFVYVGLISYGLYLWHLPVFRIVTWELPGLDGIQNILLKVSLSFVLAVLSARLIERPFREWQSRFREVEREAGAAASGLT